jgi:molecular chaperone HscB
VRLRLVVHRVSDAEWTARDLPMLEIHHDGECWRCAERTGLRVACLACDAPQPLARNADLFAVLGLPRRLTVSRDDLERCYLEASRVVHPDRHQTADARTRALSLAASAAVNKAHRTLRDPLERGRYWLELHGEPLGRDNNQVPPALAELVFDTQETLEAFRAGAATREGVRTTHAALDARVRGLVRDLEDRYAAWDAADPADASVLVELKRRLSEIAYLETLVEDVDAALGT